MNARSSGTIFALQIQSKEGYAYNHPVRKNLYQWFLERDVLLRPLGNVIYTVPPYCLSAEELHYLQNQILVMLQNFEVNQNYPSTENPGLG
jgi:adenosylmethionine-8-amino-7-oxononanoate aminotransferase